MSILTVENLSVSFGTHQAVKGINLTVAPQECIGIIGASGSGKTAAIHAIAQISTGTISGKIIFAKDTTPSVGLVLQEPMTSLNPTMKIGKQITEGLLYHKMISRRDAQEIAIQLLTMVGIENPSIRIHQYSHELSGGMRQRVLIAIALACNPSLLIADEPTTAQDVVTQRELLQLLKSLQRSMIVISHDFRIISALCDTVYVMQAGQFVESGPIDRVFKDPQHPYTKMLINSVPRKRAAC